MLNPEDNLSEIRTLEEALLQIEKLKQELVTVRKAKNGSNLIVLDKDERILVVREKTREKRWMLPGGGIERGELPLHACITETEEESGLLVPSAHIRLIGHFVQQPIGVVFLYETHYYKGEIVITEDNEDVSEARFMSLEEIVANAQDFRLAYLRMIARYMRCRFGLDPTPYEGSLADKVEFPRDLDFGKFRKSVLSV